MVQTLGALLRTNWMHTSKFIGWNTRIAVAIGPCELCLTQHVCVFSNKSTLGYMMQEFWMLPFLSSRSGTKVNAVYVCDEKGAGSGSGDSELVVTCDQAYFISDKTWEITRVMLTESLIACYLPMKSKRTLIPRLRFMEAILIKL